MMTWLEAIYDIPSKSYRRTKNGRYETFCSDHSKYMYLGTYDSPEEAERVAFNYRADRLCSRVEEHGLNAFDGIVFMDNYIAFDNGMIFNLAGERMVGALDRNGYRHGIFNRQYIQFHRVIASIFCEREPGKDYVNHIDGNKDNNCEWNLEWVTSKENIDHAIKHNLMTAGVGSGENHPCSTITEKTARYICELLEQNELSYDEISKLTGASCSVIGKIKNGHRWKNVSKDYNVSNYTSKR